MFLDLVCITKIKLFAKPTKDLRKCVSIDLNGTSANRFSIELPQLDDINLNMLWL